MRTVFIYKTAFTNGRPDYMDAVIARDEKHAAALAEYRVRGVCDERPCDHEAEVVILGALATDAESLADYFTE